MDRSENITELVAALAKAQSEFQPVPKNKTAKVRMKTGGEFSYKYADLADCLSMALPILSANGIAFSQPNLLLAGKLRVTTMLMHSSGQWLRSDGIEISEDGDPQQFGSESTYFRRYDGCSFIGIAPDEDTDGAVGNDDKRKRKEVTAEVEKQKGPTLDVPPEMDWSYNKASGVLICRIMEVSKGVTKAGKDYLTLTVNNELDKGKKPPLYYWHATHRDALLAAKDKVVKLLVIAKEKGFTVDAVMEIGGVKIGLDDSDKEGDTSTRASGMTSGGSTTKTTKVTDVLWAETQARLLASVMGFEDEDLRELHALCHADWVSVLKALKIRKAEVEAGVEAGSR